MTQKIKTQVTPLPFSSPRLCEGTQPDLHEILADARWQEDVAASRFPPRKCSMAAHTAGACWRGALPCAVWKRELKLRYQSRIQKNAPRKVVVTVLAFAQADYIVQCHGRTHRARIIDEAYGNMCHMSM